MFDEMWQLFDVIWQPMLAYLSAMQGAWPPAQFYALLMIIAAIAGVAELPSVGVPDKLRQRAWRAINVSFFLAFAHILLFLAMTIVMTLIKDGQLHVYVALHFVVLWVVGRAAIRVHSVIVRQHTKAAQDGFG